VSAKVAALDGAALLSIISRVELEGGVYRDPVEAAVRHARLDLVLDAFPVPDFDRQAADAHRAIVEAAGYSRRKILNPMTAAQPLVHRAALVTRNAAEFQDIPGLILVAW